MEVEAVVARAIGRFSPELKSYVLEDIVEIEKDVGIFRRGSDAAVIDLDWRGTKCVGKMLHQIFFQPGTQSAGMQRMLEKFFKEIKLLSEMDHPNIVKFLGIYYKQDPALSIELPVLVMEKMEWSLTEYLNTHEKGSIPEFKMLHILLDVSEGLVYLHEKMKVAHRDLSSNNILLAADLGAKIADLGSARVLDRSGGWNSLFPLTRQPGTPDFMPPEALVKPPKYTVSVDVFSFGCVIIHLCTHKWPEPFSVPKGTFVSEIELRQKCISEMDDSDLLPIVVHCLEENSDERPKSSHLKFRLENIIGEKVASVFCHRLQQYMLESVQEMPQGTQENEIFIPHGNILNLNFNGIHCTGTMLNSTSLDFSANPSRIDHFCSKIEPLSKINHDNIVQFFGIHFKPDFSLPVLVMERMECSLTEYLSAHEKGSIPENKVLNILFDTSKGLVYLHKEMKIIHKDLSSNMILLAANLSAKIADPFTKFTEKSDTLDFMPPEVLKDSPQYTVSVDVFSFGCVIIHLCTHKWPEPIKQTVQRRVQKLSEFKRRDKYITEICNLDLLPIVEQCLQDLNEKRPTSTYLKFLLEAIIDTSSILHERFQQYMVKNVKEMTQGVQEDESRVSKAASYGKIVNLYFNGTHCIGKMLHFRLLDFSKDSKGSMMQNLCGKTELLSKMKYSNIVQFVGIFYKQDSLLPVLVMEKMEYSLTMYLRIREKGSISAKRALNILLGVSKGLVYLHEEIKIAHGDLSSDNIFLTANLDAKITDDRSTRVLDMSGGWNPYSKSRSKSYTMDFMPPEALKSHPEYTASGDVFSFGCVMIHLYTHKWPKPDPVTNEKVSKEVKRRQKYTEEMANYDLLPMVRQCLADSSKDRPASIDVMSSLLLKAEEKQPDYTVVLIGVIGTGKSTAGNIFLNGKYFAHGSSLHSVKNKCSSAISIICGKTVKIIDTPCFYDELADSEKICQELRRALILAKDGISAVAFVMRNDRYTEQYEKGIQELQLFKGLEPFVFVLLTHANNEGVTKASTDEYIQQTLSNSHCPKGFKNLMKLVKNRVIMLESTNTVEHYRAHKNKEFITMIENIHKSNAYKICTNSMLQHTAQVYEKVKLEQLVEIRIATELLQEKIQQLKKQAKDNTNSKATKMINDEIVALELKNKKLERTLKEHLENLVNKILQNEMEKNKITAQNIMRFIGGYLGYQAEKSVLYQGVQKGIAATVVGGIFGAIAGSVVPGAGTTAGITIGIQVATIGATVIDAAYGHGKASKPYGDCKQQ